MNVTTRTMPKQARLLCTVMQVSGHGTELCRLGLCGDHPPRQRTFRRGDRIPLHEGPPMRFQVIRHGLVACCIVTPDGRRQITCLNAPGDVICGMAGRDATGWYEALAECDVCEFEPAHLAERMENDPSLSRLLMTLLHDRLERASTHVTVLGRFDATERLCSFLADMARRTGTRHNGSGLWRFPMPMSRDDIADYLGLNPDTVGRVMKRLKAESLIRLTEASRCEVPDLAQLEARIPFQFAAPGERAACGLR